MKKILSWSWFIFTRVLIPFFVILLAYDYGNNAALISMSIIIYTTISYAIDQLTKLQSLRFLSMSERLVNIGYSSKTIGKDQKESELREIVEATEKINQEEAKRIVYYISLFLMQIVAVFSMM
ncbi:MAG: hypothetical protein HN981_02155 [Candidatus Pacebacteria bacterium]|nr:hypothetical protein [Candidatus Paceibacterota bacterium]MBT6921175.1 hypothetical protein [Candidatus Paceibacterota bacterium]